MNNKFDSAGLGAVVAFGLTVPLLFGMILVATLYFLGFMFFGYIRDLGDSLPSPEEPFEMEGTDSVIYDIEGEILHDDREYYFYE